MSEQSITIQGVPASITRAQVIEALQILGIDPFQVVEFSRDASTTALHVTVHADGAEGPGFRWSYDGRNSATHRLTIPILDEETPA